MKLRPIKASRMAGGNDLWLIDGRDLRAAKRVLRAAVKVNEARPEDPLLPVYYTDLDKAVRVFEVKR